MVNNQVCIKENCLMCALYENDILPEEKCSCKALHDLDSEGQLIPDFDREMERVCYAPSIHKLAVVDEELMETTSFMELYTLFLKKYCSAEINGEGDNYDE